MNEKTTGGVPWSFWAIGAIALVWNVLGAMNYMMQMNPDMVATYPETHRAIIDGRPAWATGGFAITVFGGALGCLLLLFRRSVALYVFIASLLGVLVTTVHTLKIVTSTAGFTAFEIMVMTVMPVIVAALLAWYTRLAMNKGWLR
jgi:hypothetical protein